MVRLDGLRLTVVGPGRVGSSLALWARAAGAEVRSVAGRGAALAALDSAADDGLLLTVPDAALDDVASTLAARRQAPIALHVSGAAGAEAIVALRSAGSAVGSLHPLSAFAAVVPAPPPGLVFGIDGDEAALVLARRCAAAWGAEAVVIGPEARLLYHFGATLAAGGTTTLLATAAHLAHDLGLPVAVGRGYRELARGAITAMDPEAPARAITGPVARGDRDLVARQLEALESSSPDLVALAISVGLATLHAIEREPGGLSGSQAELRASLGARASQRQIRGTVESA